MGLEIRFAFQDNQIKFGSCHSLAAPYLTVIALMWPARLFA
jgi:hypothetical protein